MNTHLAEFCAAFETRKRNDGKSFVCLKDDSPEWMTELTHAAHGDMMPDDTRYTMIQECADSLNEREQDSWDDAIFEIADGLVDVYNMDRLRWLSSHLERAFYVDEAQEEGLISGDTDTFTRLGIGQFKEYEEILYTISQCPRILDTEE